MSCCNYESSVDINNELQLEGNKIGRLLTTLANDVVKDGLNNLHNDAYKLEREPRYYNVGYFSEGLAVH